MDFYTGDWSTCLHIELMNNLEKCSQKVSVELDEQSLSYAETCNCVQHLALALLDTNLSHRHKIIYQIVERSIELPIGMFAIFTVGHIYLGLNPDDPILQLSSRIHDTATAESFENEDKIDQVSYPSTAIILCHQMTHEQVQKLTMNVDVQLEPFNISTLMSLMTMTEALNDDDFVRLSNIDVSKMSSACLICTSGSTGKPKIVEHTHGSLIHNLHCMDKAQLYCSIDNIFQLASCQWVTHIWDVTVSQCLGSTLVLLHPGGQLDVNYLMKTMVQKQISTLISLPTTARLLAERDATKSNESVSCFRYLRAYILGGSAVTEYHVGPLMHAIKHQRPLPLIMVTYGASEILLTSKYVINWDLSHTNNERNILPIGKNIPGRQCFLRDINNGQRITTNDTIGELCAVADDGVFKCYRGNPTLTARIKVIPSDASTSVSYVRSGDLCRYNNNGDLVYVGRADFRFKIYGQMVEPEAIEQKVMKANNSVDGCVVRKEEGQDLNDEYLSCHLLVTSTVDSQDLIHKIIVYCQQNLPSFMIPVAWQVHDKFPLTPSGKLDRKQLGAIKRTHNVDHIQDKLPNETNGSLVTNDEPMTEREKQVFDIWCEVLSIIDPAEISATANLFSLGCNSFHFMNIVALYRDRFGISTHFPSITTLLQHSTIREHALAFEQTFMNGSTIEKKLILQPLHVIEGPISLSQQMSFRPIDNTKVADQLTVSFPYDLANVVAAFAVEKGCVSIERLRQALHLVIQKHATLHSSFFVHPESKQCWQRIEPLVDEGFTFIASQLNNDENALEHLIQQEHLVGLHDVQHGRLVRFHIVHTQQNAKKKEDTLVNGDFIIINIRHEAIDGTSLEIFLRDWADAYKMQQLPFDSNAPTYLDYTIYEKQLDLSNSFLYWKRLHEGFNVARHVSRLPLKIGYERFSGMPAEPRIITFKATDGIVEAMLDCAKVNNVTLGTVCTACYAAFLFQLTNSWDVVFEMVVACRPLEYEAKDLLGDFYHIPIVRVKLEETKATFISLLHTTQSMIINTVEHGRCAKNPPENDLPKWHHETDHKVTRPPITGFEYHEVNNDLILDSLNDTVLKYLYNDRDGVPAAFWIRAGTPIAWVTNVFYKPFNNELLFANFFSVTAYDKLVAEQLNCHFNNLISTIFDGTSTNTRLEQPLSNWLHPLDMHTPETCSRYTI